MDIYYLRSGKIGEPRTTQNSPTFPFADTKVPLMLISAKQKQVIIATSAHDKLKLLGWLKDGEVLLAAWPGSTRQDVFVIPESDYLRLEQALKKYINQ